MGRIGGFVGSPVRYPGKYPGGQTCNAAHGRIAAGDKSFSHAVRSIRTAAMYVFFAAIFSTNVTSDTTKKDGNRKKTPKGSRMKTPFTLKLRVKVGSVKLVLAMAGVRRRPFTEGGRPSYRKGEGDA